MKKKVVWVVVSCLIVVTLLLTSCAQVAEEEEEVVTPEEEEEIVPVEEEVVAEEKEMVRDSLGRLVEEPQYGGWLMLARSGSVTQWDEEFGMPGHLVPQCLTNEDLGQVDWAKGPTGSGEYSLTSARYPRPPLMAPCLAESWEFPSPGTIIYHIRKGVHFHNKPPVNGREMDANDVVYSIERIYESDRCYTTKGNPYFYESVYAPDKWTVVIECPSVEKPETTAKVWEVTSAWLYIVPHEVIDEYGKDGLNDWRNVCGTGPFVAKDYVHGSSLVFERHPNYWQKDPLHPENQLPYIDGVTWLIIPDLSTRIAALRTGKIDRLSVSWEEAPAIRQTNPELKESKYVSTMPSLLFMRVDKPELPFYDKSVRRALQMAVDRQTIINDYYGGQAEILASPILPMKDFTDWYTPLEQMPDSVQELFKYDPDKAKQLLAEAGYPDGFQTEVVCTSGYADLLSIIKAYWADVGVDLEIDVRESGAYNALMARKTFSEMLISYAIHMAPEGFYETMVGNFYNRSMVDDERCMEAYTQMWLWENYQDDAKQAQIMKEIVPYILDQAWWLQFPLPNSYAMWWPWLKHYNGEINLSYALGTEREVMFVWLDQELRKSMGY